MIKDILAVLPGEDGLPGVRRATVRIDGGIVSAVYTSGTDDKVNAGDKVFSGAGKLLTPGYVNAHTHAYMTMLRNQADDLDFDTWLFKRVMPAEDAMTADDAYWSVMLSCMEMLRQGVTSFLDMHMFPGTVVRAVMDTGMRAVISRGLSGSAEDVSGGERRLREALREIDEFSGASDRISFMMAPHAVTTCDEGYLRAVAEKARELGLGIHSHLAEGQTETELVRSKYGCTPTEFYDRCGLLAGDSVLAHCIHVSGGDMDILAERGVSVALNHVSNLKLANGIPPVPAYMERGINLCLGTDSACSNNALSVRREMMLAVLIHKGLGGDPTAVNAAEAFNMATANGARALRLRQTGEIRAGYTADLAIFDIDKPEMTPLGDPVAALCYSAMDLAADTVFVGGETVLENGVFTKFDAEEVMRKMRRSSALHV